MDPYEQMTTTIQSALEGQGFMTWEIWHLGETMTQIAVIRPDSEITPEEVSSALDEAIPGKYLEPAWISEKGEVYIHTWKYWNRKES